ncbi:MAG TPA: acyl carrier protein [Rubrivivax sp.]|nr:acyl carrier protein [Rubrivivax sp.]
MSDSIKQQVKDYIMSEFLPGESPDELTDSTPLITGGILDSIATLKLVLFMEERWRVSFEPHEVDRENLDTLDLITALLRSKLGPGAA